MSIIAKTDIRKEVKKYIDKADDRMVTIIHAMLKADNEQADWWDDITEGERASIDKGLRELEEGRGIPHELLVKKHPEWFVR